MVLVLLLVLVSALQLNWYWKWRHWVHYQCSKTKLASRCPELTLEITLNYIQYARPPVCHPFDEDDSRAVNHH
nr:hypothetical protein BaRGS_005175 [Batillaria attramentaria]